MSFFDGFRDVLITCPFAPTLISVQMKAVEVVHIRNKFHLYVTCNSEVLIFQKLSYQQKVQFQAVSGWFYGQNPP